MSRSSQLPAHSRCLSPAIFLRSRSNTAIAPSVKSGYHSWLKKVTPNFVNSTGGNVSTSKIFLCTSTLPAQSREVDAVFQTSLVRDEAGRDAQPEIILVQVPGRPYEDWTLDGETSLIPAIPAGSMASLSCHHATRSGCRPPSLPWQRQDKTDEN